VTGVLKYTLALHLIYTSKPNNNIMTIAKDIVFFTCFIYMFLTQHFPLSWNAYFLFHVFITIVVAIHLDLIKRTIDLLVIHRRTHEGFPDVPGHLPTCD